MTVSKIRFYIFLVVAGFLLLAVDIYSSTGIDYPQKYKNNKNIIGEYQYYNIQLFYTATYTLKPLEITSAPSEPVDTTQNSESSYSSAEVIDDVFFDGFKIDIFNDVVGFLLIAISCFGLLKYEKLFKPGLVFAITSIVVKLILTALPFALNGMALCNIALGVGIAYLAATILTTYFTSKGFINLIKDSCCRQERLWVNTSWFVSMVLMVLIMFVSWLDLYSMAHFFTGVLVLDIIVYGTVLKRVDEFAARNCNI